MLTCCLLAAAMSLRGGGGGRPVVALGTRQTGGGRWWRAAAIIDEGKQPALVLQIRSGGVSPRWIAFLDRESVGNCTYGRTHDEACRLTSLFFILLGFDKMGWAGRSGGVHTRLTGGIALILSDIYRHDPKLTGGQCPHSP